MLKLVLFQVSPSSGRPPALEDLRLIPSWIESLDVLKSPIFHSPNAMVLLVPSVISLMDRFPAMGGDDGLFPSLGVAIAKIPLGFAEVQGARLGPTDAK